MFELIARVVSFFIPNKTYRKEIRRIISYLPYIYRIKKTAQKVGRNLYVGGPSFVNENTILGDNVGFSGVSVNGKGRLVIGDNFRSGSELLFLTQNHNYENSEKLPYDDTYIYKETIVGNCVWAGARVTILPGTKIGDGVVIQAGSVVHGTIPPYAIIGGNPARIIKYRDIDHFNKLAKEKCYNYNP